MDGTEKITIVEGPPPTFVLARDTWLYGLVEGSASYRVALCRLRSLNGPVLVQRCHDAWCRNQTVYLEYRDEEGVTRLASIVAARWVEVPAGHMLLLWVSLEESQLEIELDMGLSDIGGWDDAADGPQDNLSM
jgi:hypothetical protein